MFALCAGLHLGAGAQGIFTCIDGRGKRLTSDRPIPECMDREQKELNSSGTVKRSVAPVLTPQEEAAQAALEKKDTEDKARANEERRRNRALLARYKNQAAHDASRSEALTQVDEVIRAANTRLADLAQQRKSLDAEMEFYAKDPSKAPFALRRRMTDNDESVLAQQRFIANQQQEKQRVNDRFDEELARLKPLWSGAR
jgi:hypothetical protein